MPHINELIDFVVGAFVVENDKVLLIDHKKLGCWLCPGGHIELHEDPEQAVHREVKEETGLDIEIVGVRPDPNCPRTKSFIPPRFFNRHPINEKHDHIGIHWLARRKAGETTLAAGEHNAIGWFTAEEVLKLNPMWPSIRYYAMTALSELKEDPIQVGRRVYVVGQNVTLECRYQFMHGKVIYVDGDNAVVEFGECCQVFRKKALKLEEPYVAV